MADNNAPGPSKGYQKKIKKENKEAQPKTKANVDYSSPMAKKWPLLLEALQNGNLEVVKQLIEEGINVNLLRDGVTPLMIASSGGRTEIAEEILQAGANINEKSDAGRTALHEAAFNQADAGIVELLMQSGIDVESKDSAGKTALNLAEEKGHRDIVRVIKKHRAQLAADAREWEDFLNSSEGKPYKRQKLYETLTLYSKLLWLPPLALGGAGLLLGFFLRSVILSAIIGIVVGLLADFAYFYLETSVRKYLDKVGPLPDLDIRTLRLKRKAGEPILVGNKEPLPGEEAAIAGSAESVSLPDSNLSSAEEEPDGTLVLEQSAPETPAFEVTGNRALVTLTIAGLILLILFGITFTYREPLFKLYYAKKLAYQGIPFTERAFMNEVAKNNEESVDLFVKAGINENAVNEKGQTALIIASDKGHTRLIEKLAKLSPKELNHFDKTGNTALMTAVRLGHEQAVKMLIENGADVNFTVKSANGAATALQAALDGPDFKDEHMRIMQYLLQKGADAKGRNSAGQFPLLFAVGHGFTEAAKVVIEHGADVNDADQKGNFPLMSAACKGYPWLVALLVEKGAMINMASPDGSTPLMCAVREGQTDIAKMLLDKGASVNAKTNTGSAALTDATNAGSVEMAKLLLGHGADPGTGFLPVSLVSVKGKSIAIRAKKIKLADALGRIAGTASPDGYTIRAESIPNRKSALAAKGPWNRVLIEFARKNHLLLVVKDKEIYVLPYGK